MKLIYLVTFLSLISCNPNSSFKTVDATLGATITMSKFEQVKEGMSYEQVKEIIGDSGAVISSSELGGVKTVMYQWQNPSGANMNAMFQNGKLVNKAQFGL